MDDSSSTTPAPDAIRNLVMVCIGLTSVFVAQTMLLLAVPLRALELGASPSLVGLILSAPYLLPLVFAIPLGGIVTRVGPQKVFFIGAVGMMLGPWLSVALPTFSGLLATQVVIGLAHVVMVIAAQSVVAGLGRGRALERYFGWYTMCLSGGQLVGPLLAGRLIDTLGMGWVFAAIGAIPAISLISSCYFVGNARRGHATPRSLLGYRAQASLLRDNIGVQMSIAVTVAVLFALGAHAAFLPVYLEELTFSATLIGVLVSLRALSAMLIRPIMPQVIQAMGGRSKTMIASVAAVAMGLMWTGMTGSAVALAVLAMLVGLGSGISQPLSMVILAEHVKPEQRSSALGMRLMGNRGAQVLAPLILGVIAELVGFTLTFLLAGAALLAVMLLVIRLAPAFDQAERDNTD
ncbi:MFS transporter [Billgrantia endophytica]|uniref:MFS transporter n=1 Tax=Billgrantia endophytica TaxID=2033802 RepID=A0A2N7TY82_9GAMM|nr:MFS transporter [Halomonas endophytica]PMR73154.1 MFS transporter [Halomonas endophytica]